MSQEPTGEPQPEPPFARALPPPPFAQYAPPVAPAPVAAPLQPGELPPPPVAEHAPSAIDALPYSLPSTLVRRTRPSLVTLLGWGSAVVAFLGGVASVATIGFAAVFFLAAKEADRIVAAAPVLATPPAFLVPYEAGPRRVQVGPDGLDDEPRRVAVNAMYSVRPLRPPRMEQLDAILARAGRRILALEAGAPVTVEQVRSAVVDSGELFGPRGRAPPEYFKTSAGRLELLDDRAVFYPDDGSPAVRSTTASSAMPKALTQEQVAAVVKQVQAAPGGERLSMAQVSGMTAVLGLPNQKLAQVATGLNKEPREVKIHAGGEATVTFAGGQLHLGKQGEVLPAPPPPPGTARASSANVAALALTEVAAVAGLVLAVLLFVASIATLRRTGRRTSTGRKLHTLWAVLKIPVAVGGGLALCWMLNTFTESMAALPRNIALPGGTVGRTVRWAQLVYWPVLVAAALACVYPVVVLALLRTKAVRAYFEPGD